MTDRADAGHKTISGPVVGAPAFTGRRQELADLTQVLAGPAGVILVEGEAGIGKTRLIGEFLASPAGRTHKALVACCPPYLQPHTLGPVADALRQSVSEVTSLRLSALAGVLRPLFPEWAANLPPAPEPAEDATAARYRLFAGLAELLDRLAVTMLVAEDAHWADEATVEFLLFLAARQARRTTLVVTSRAEEVQAGSLLPRLARHAAGGGGLHMTLNPLSAADTAKLMSSMLAGEPVSAEFAQFVHQRTDGVPLAIEESVRLMVTRGDVRRDGGLVRRRLADITVPPTIRSGVIERAGRLTREAQAMLRASAVLSEPADEATLRSVAAISSRRSCAGLSAALECGLLAEDARGRVSFRHQLASRAIYEAIPGPQRRSMHLRAGYALERISPPPLAQLAWHFRAAGQLAEWCCYAEQAASQALTAGDETTAIALLNDLLTHAELPPGSVVRLMKKMPFASLTGQEPVRNLAGILMAILDSGVTDAADEADLRLLLGRVLLILSDRDAARAELERAIPHLGDDGVEAAWAAILLGWPHGTVWPASEHRRWLDRAADLTAAAAPADRLNLTVERASALLMLGDETGWEVAAHIPDDAASPRERMFVAKGHMNIGSVAMVPWGLDDEARRRLQRALDLTEAHQYRGFQDVIMASLVHLDWLSGAWNGLSRRATELASRPDTKPLSRLEVTLVRGLLHTAVGRHAQAREDLALVLSEGNRRAEVEVITEAAAALARLLLADDRADEALRVTEDPVTVLARKGIWVWATDVVPVRVEALITAGREAQACQLTEQFADGLLARDAPAPQAALLTCQALVAGSRGQHAEAADLIGRAAMVWQSLPRPYPMLLTRERQARCLLAAGEEEAALRQLTEVQHGLAQLGATGDARRVASTLRRHGFPVPSGGTGGRPGYGGELSPRELEVVRLVVDGQTNREIAGALSRSPKTVDTQLSSAMRKLGVSSRTALAVTVVSAGIVPSTLPSGAAVPPLA